MDRKTFHMMKNRQQIFATLHTKTNSQKNIGAYDRISSDPATSRYEALVEFVTEASRTQHSVQINESMHQADLRLATRGILGLPPLFEHTSRPQAADRPPRGMRRTPLMARPPTPTPITEVDPSTAGGGDHHREKEVSRNPPTIAIIIVPPRALDLYPTRSALPPVASPAAAQPPPLVAMASTS
jgi:hypothetical protein